MQLQWGRGVFAAEGRVICSGQLTAPGFNGAAACSPRKAYGANIVEMEKRMLQWGRGVFAAEGRALARLPHF